jgi:Methyltransferase domain
MAWFAKRVIQPELLDHASPEDARRNLAEIVRLNESFGGHGVIRKLLAKAIGPGERFFLLDVGAASGDSARLIARHYPLATVISLDHNWMNLSAAPHPKMIGDAFDLPFPAQSVDYVFSSLFLHHFSDADVVRLLRNFYDKARRGVLICDLERHFVSYCFLPLTKPLFGWQRLTLHDGPVSVRAAFRAKELQELAKSAGILNAEVTVHRPAFRLSLFAKK